MSIRMTNHTNFFNLFQTHTANLVMYLITIFETIYSFGMTFFCCELGQQITNVFAECSAAVEELDWFLFSPKIQRMLPIIMSFAQQPTVFYCFGSISSSRDTFKRVRIDCS